MVQIPTNGIGGIVGSCGGSITKSCNIGNISGRDAAGIIGRTKASGSYTPYIEKCFNSGRITGTQYLGLIAGKVWLKTTIKDCYYNDKYESSLPVTGYVNSGVQTTVSNNTSTTDDFKTLDEFITWIDSK